MNEWPRCRAPHLGSTPTPASDGVRGDRRLPERRSGEGEVTGMREGSADLVVDAADRWHSLTLIVLSYN